MVFLLLFFAMQFFLFLNISLGTVGIAPGEILRSMQGERLADGMETILWQIRFPRAMAALFLGGALSLSGYLLQSFFHNPIAGPFILGISSGAKLFVALTMIFALERLGRVSSLLLIGAAFFGAVFSMALVLLMSRWVPRMSQLIIAGVMIGYICTAITDFLIAFAEDSDIVNLHNWARGSFSGMSPEHVQVILVLTLLCFFVCFLLAKPMAALQQGESYAGSVGVNVGRLKILLVLLSSLLSASVVAFAGPISFVGVAVPQLVRILLKSERPLWMIPACFMGGGVFCLFSDLLARLMFSPTELSISTVTAVFGAPVVILLMLRPRGEMR